MRIFIPMKKTFLLLILSICSCSVFSQTILPDFVSNLRYESNIDTLLRSHVKQFDLIIALRTHYNWKYDADYHLLVHRNGQWQKMNLRNKKGSLAKFDPPVPVANKFKGEADSLYLKLVANNIFTIDDDDIYPTCNQVDTVINGRHRKFPIGVENAAGYSLWIIKPQKSRLLYYYAPEYFIRYCSPYWDRRNAIDIITLLNHNW
ncbi:hypothetical protein RG47T_3793 [Mucilaginibacter polytrichastri]|uniref:Uncharacterized protein n=2 Tax=Mucilaginibacter polytrichastri TaxID=1302689 RepID=A0A1Q6A2T5_9SPHI|nr:hypothetical protein RG47T_3793 [Mucilaginibacter polytrichastri]SFT13743.1 hypothetical protein SAMN04487890_11265 [Mucilaginibacter polytrichastri]